ncbi:hypothetical protein V494_00225 [Pseudogymnoascus sp. VKM F-4513 (FW-928)]|nr:hypothetical protein V494_00225 [Pseudogymnoascus sp. VKM F-4513 (FW-928)]
MSKSGSVVGEKSPVEKENKAMLKIAFPNNFKGEQSQLKAFLLQCNLYIGFNSKHFDNKTAQVLWAVALLRGPATD